MQDITQAIILFNKELEHALSNTQTIDTLEQVRIAFLGRNGQLTSLMAQLKTISPDEKREFGPRLNQLKKRAQESFNNRLEELKKQAARQKELLSASFDVTAYQTTIPEGSLHIYTTLIQELEDIFISMGYRIEDGPEVESSYYNFETLNIPEDHPARDMHDTFWLNIPGLLLRTHTSNVQARAMQKHALPLAIFAPGRCYRNESLDATHEFMFTQAEGILIDKNISVSNLLATAQTFIRTFFRREDLKLRVRPGYFPFVEPGLEIDASCPFCSDGCSVCKKTKWIELMGAGLIHPNVLRASNIDPDEYSGFAFGFGIERFAMIRNTITDIRLFHSNKLDFLKQF